MNLLQEIENSVSMLLKEYDSALEKGNTTKALKVAIKIERELNKLEPNEIKIVTPKEDQSTTTVQ